MSEIAIALASLMIGALLTYASEEIRRSRARRDARQDALRSQRAEAYKGFVMTTHRSAHMIGRAARNSDVPLGPDQSVADVFATVDAEVGKALLELEIIAEERTLAAARSLRDALRDLRRAVEGGAVYMEADYQPPLRAYQARRAEFLTAARREILGGGAT